MFFGYFVFLCVTSSLSVTGFYTEDEPRILALVAAFFTINLIFGNSFSVLGQMTSRQPCWRSETKKQQPFWRSENILLGIELHFYKTKCKCKYFVCSGSALSYQASLQAPHAAYLKKEFKLNRNIIKNPNWQEATSWLFTKRGGVESGTTGNKS